MDETRSVANRKAVFENIVNSFDCPNFSSLEACHLEQLFALYDQIVFDGMISKKMERTSSTIRFKVLNQHIISRAGRCVKQRKVYQFEFPRKLYLSLFVDPDIKVLTANGIECYDRLSCLQVVFEHELAHLMIMMWEIDIGRDTHGPFFVKTVKHYFGHTSCNVCFMSGDTSQPPLTPSSAMVGQKVKFYDYKSSKNHFGTLVKINRVTAVIENEQKKTVMMCWHVVRSVDA